MVLAAAAIQAGLRSRAMPHFGQSLGCSDSTPGHIGQKYFAAAAGFIAASAAGRDWQQAAVDGIAGFFPSVGVLWVIGEGFTLVAFVKADTFVFGVQLIPGGAFYSCRS